MFFFQMMSKSADAEKAIYLKTKINTNDYSVNLTYYKCSVDLLNFTVEASFITSLLLKEIARYRYYKQIGIISDIFYIWTRFTI